MGAHLIDGEFQSDKYPTTPRGKVPLSVKDPMAQDLLSEYARRRAAVDAEFSDDLDTALHNAGYEWDSLETKIVERVRAWFARMVKYEDPQGKSIKIELGMRQGDDDGTLYLEALIEEKNFSEVEGRVPGAKF